MEIIYENEAVPYEKTAVVLGNFDGLHKAHTEIIKQGTEYAKEHGIKSGVFMFCNNTKTVTENKSIKLITDNDEKLKLLEGMGLDFVYIVNFSREFMQKTPEEFVLYFTERLNPEAVFTGYDYRFGCKASGDTRILSEFGEKYGFTVSVLPEMKIENQTVSSTYIRNLIENGDIITAKRFLGRYFSIGGLVEKGLQNGRKMGFPTANVSYSENIVLPDTGVYAGYTLINGKIYKSVINVGNNPTFNAKKVTVESHIFDFSDDIYGENIRVIFVEKIRGEIKFSGLDTLKAQIADDTENAHEILSREECENEV